MASIRKLNFKEHTRVGGRASSLVVRSKSLNLPRDFLRWRRARGRYAIARRVRASDCVLARALVGKDTAGGHGLSRDHELPLQVRHDAGKSRRRSSAAKSRVTHQSPCFSTASPPSRPLAHPGRERRAPRPWGISSCSWFPQRPTATGWIGACALHRYLSTPHSAQQRTQPICVRVFHSTPPKQWHDKGAPAAYTGKAAGNGGLLHRPCMQVQCPSPFSFYYVANFPDVAVNSIQSHDVSSAKWRCGKSESWCVPRTFALRHWAHRWPWSAVTAAVGAALQFIFFCCSSPLPRACLPALLSSRFRQQRLAVFYAKRQWCALAAQASRPAFLAVFDGHGGYRAAAHLYCSTTTIPLDSCVTACFRPRTPLCGGTTASAPGSVDLPGSDPATPAPHPRARSTCMVMRIRMRMLMLISDTTVNIWVCPVLP